MLGVFIHGLKMDISMASYLCLLLFTLLSISVVLANEVPTKIITWMTTFFLVIFSIIMVADLELFKEWGFRIDSTPISYLTTPREMAASSASSPYILLIISIALTIFLGFRIYKTTIYPRLRKLTAPNWLLSIVYLLLAGLMIIPIRGGLQLAPMNQSVAFFSNNDFANQAAINAPWNFFWSFSKNLHSSKNPYSYLDGSRAKQLVNEYYVLPDNRTERLLTTPKPNIIILLWESFSSKVVPALGGSYTGVVPEFEKLIHEGVLFTNFYANGNRSDKGLVAILSGYPPQPKRSIVKIPAKSSQLPVVTKVFNQNGYHTGYFHGGELEFANIKSYLVNARFNTIVGKDSFHRKDMNSKWGAHDHVVLEKAFEEINKQPAPFFNLIFTLSSHEPFDIPTPPKFPGEDLEDMYKSSLFYTDQAIGNFIKTAKLQSWYENTLIIILADHGHRLLGDAPRYQKSRFHVPMLWLGGALAVKDSIISKTCAQTDLPRTILTQLVLDHNEFLWSKDIFNPHTTSGAFYVFNEGIGFVDGDETVIYDHPSQHLLARTPGIDDSKITLAKAHLQFAYQDYLDK